MSKERFDRDFVGGFNKALQGSVLVHPKRT